jgi:isopenicillin N synthase-like dioxygenase
MSHRAFNMNEFIDGKAQQPLPEPLKSHESEVDAFASKCHALCLRILQLFAIGLGIDEASGGKNWFNTRHDRVKGPSGSVFRLLYYPQLDLGNKFDSQKDIRAGAHSDYGTITLLFQNEDQPGLEILTDGGEDSWSPVLVNPTSEIEVPILVNVGDLLSYWTNGLLKSTVHRVVFPHNGSGEDRYSIAYFCHPLDDARLEPIPSKIVQTCVHETGPLTRVERGTAMTAKEHLETRLRATYDT